MLCHLNHPQSKQAGENSKRVLAKKWHSIREKCSLTLKKLNETQPGCEKSDIFCAYYVHCTVIEVCEGDSRGTQEPFTHINVN